MYVCMLLHITARVVLESYISILITSHQYPLVALYASKLSLSRRVAVYAHMFQSWSDSQLANQSIDDVESIASRDIILQHAKLLFEGDLCNILSIYGELLVFNSTPLTSILPSVNRYG